MHRKSTYLFVVAALLILFSLTASLVQAQGGGEVRAVDFVGAWVDAGAPNGDFNFTATDGNTYTANFEADVLPLFTEADVWFPGSQACTDCHFAASEDSYHEMDLSTYEGILVGADVLSKPPGEEIIEPGDWHASGLRARLRNNRMPPGWEFDLTESNRDGPTLTVDGGEVRAVDFVGAWVDAGAPNGDFSFEDASGSSHTANFEANVLPLFTEADVWFSGSQACTDCHFAASEDSYHEMDLSTYEGILVGADVLSKPPGEEIIEPGDWHASGLRARLRNNRMPPGWEFDLTESNRDGPTLVVGHPADQAPATLPVSGSDNSVSTLLLWGLIATGVIILLAGIAIRRRERAGF